MSNGGMQSGGMGDGRVDAELVDFQDRIILIATQMACQGDQIGGLIVDKVCSDIVAQRVVEAHHRHNKSVEQTMEGLKYIYTTLGGERMGQSGGGGGGMGQGSMRGGMGKGQGSMGGGMGQGQGQMGGGMGQGKGAMGQTGGFGRGSWS